MAASLILRRGVVALAFCILLVSSEGARAQSTTRVSVRRRCSLADWD